MSLARRSEDRAKNTDSGPRDEPRGQPGYEASGAEVKTMVLINNGDKLSRGRPYVFNANKVLTWPQLLQEFSDQLRPTFGAVRKVYTPGQGTEITELGLLAQNGVYVLSGTEKFKPIPNGYHTDTILNQPFTSAPQRNSLSLKAPKELGVVFSGVDVPDLRRASQMILTLNVFRNGDDVNPPTKIMLKKFDLWNILRAKDAIAEKVKPTGGFCKSLRSMDGVPVKHVADIKNFGYYVAVGPYEKFRHVDYNPDGKATIVVPMHARNSFTANTYKDAEGVKRRRTFNVKLKQNGQDRIEEDAEEEEESQDTLQGYDYRKDSRHSQKSRQSQDSHHSHDSPDSLHAPAITLSQISMALDLPESRLEPVHPDLKSFHSLEIPSPEPVKSIHSDLHVEDSMPVSEAEQYAAEDFRRQQEQVQRQEQVYQQEQARQEQERQQAEQQRIAEEQRQAEERRLAEEQRLAEEERQRQERERQEQECQRQEHERQQAEQRQKEEERQRQEQQRQEDEHQWLEQERLQAERERQRLEQERLQAEQAAQAQPLLPEGENKAGQPGEQAPVGDQPLTDEQPLTGEPGVEDERKEDGAPQGEGAAVEAFEVNAEGAPVPMDGQSLEVKPEPIDLTEEEEVLPTPKKKKGCCS